VAAAVDRGLELLAGAGQRIVHGDSHPGNVLWTVTGPLWGDWEDAHLAPLEWDLACLVAASRVRGDDFGWAEAALDAHGGVYDAELLEVCVDARVAQGAAYRGFTGRGSRPRGACRSALPRAMREGQSAGAAAPPQGASGPRHPGRR
jgi:aminoglycoside phosphotransferase (APT) family kinase protein